MIRKGTSKSSLLRKLSLLVLAILPAVATGCSKKMWINKYPPFWSPDLKSVAVVPFENRTEHKDVGKYIADRLAASLSANGTYKVFNRNDIEQLLQKRDEKVNFISRKDTLDKIRSVNMAHAVITGTVTVFSANTHSELRHEPYYTYYPYYGRHGLHGLHGYHGHHAYTSYGYSIYVYTRNEANVGATASLIRLEDGQTIYSTPSAVTGRHVSKGAPPDCDPHACLSRATGKLIEKLTEQFAVVRREIEINPHEDFRTAAGQSNEQWIYSDEFDHDSAKMFVIVRLPKICARNRFKITISRAGNEEPLVEKEILWQRSFKPAGQEFKFSPSEIFDQGGAGKYIARFHSEEGVQMTREFEIEPPD